MQPETIKCKNKTIFDDLNFLKKEDDLNVLENVRRSQKNNATKTN
jgi:hypothetical protein